MFTLKSLREEIEIDAGTNADNSTLYLKIDGEYFLCIDFHSGKLTVCIWDNKEGDNPTHQVDLSEWKKQLTPNRPLQDNTREP